MSKDAAARRVLARAAWIVTGLFLFLWIGYEDRSPATVVGCAALLSLSSGLSYAAGWHRSDRQPGLLRTALTGAVAGAAVGPLSAVLMLVKTGLHSHPVAEFSQSDLLRVLGLAPAWAVAGVLLGLALGLVASANRGSRR